MLSDFQPFRMRATGSAGKHGSVSLLSILFILLFLSQEITMAEAQSGQPENSDQYRYASFSPSLATIIAVLISVLFLIAFLSIYIRHCSNTSGTIGRALSLRSRRPAAGRGLDHSVLETFPTFSYSEVKDHQIGKGALECAVCLNEFEEDETLRLLPKCDHVFHPECIDAWLESHVTCPVCRANLSEPVESDANDHVHVDIVDEPINEEGIVIQDDDVQGSVNRSSSLERPVHPPPRSFSIRRPRVFDFGKFRSHSTGHAVVQPGENLDRFTLRLPEEVKKDVLNRASLNRTKSFAAVLPTEGSSRRGYRTGGEEGSTRAVRFSQRLELPGRDIKSDRWAFFTRGLSFRSPKVKTETGEASTPKSGGKAPVKMPSFKCLSPKPDAGDESRQPPV